MIHDIQKAGMWKRISAALLDTVIFIVVMEALILLFSAVSGFSTYLERMDALEEKYFTQYGIEAELTQSEYDELSAAEQEEYRIKVEAANKAYQSDPEVVEVYGKIISLSWMMVTFPILIAFLILELAIPLIFKNGQTFGKKVFGIAIMRFDGIKITPFMTFARGILGKCTFGTLVPIYLVMMFIFGMLGTVGIIACAALLIAQVIMFFVTKYHTPIHDKLAMTIAVDMTSQIIFDTPEDRDEYYKRIFAESTDTYKS